MSDLPFTQIPDHWKLERLDHLFRLVKEPAYFDDPPVSAFIDGVVTLRSNRPDAIIKGSGQEIGYKHIETGDLVISGMNAHLGGLGISDSSGKCTPVYTVMRKTSDLDQRFISYYLWHAAQSGYIKSLVNAVRYNSADFGPETVKRFMVPVPPIDEQRRIADYLDSSLARVFSLVDAKSKELELLKELENGLINKIVASDCAIKLKHVCQSGGQYGLNIAPTHYRDAGIRLLRTSDFGSREVQPIFVEGPLEVRHTVNVGDIVLTRSGATIGQSFLITKEEAGSAFAGFLIRYRTRSSYLPEFLSLAVRSSGFQEQVKMGAVVSTIPNFNADRYDNLLIPDLPASVQQERFKAFTEENRNFLETRKLLTKTMDKLEELRTSIITAAVTGTFDVTTRRSVA